jgi:[protein-PII] uridylyltransferase
VGPPNARKLAGLRSDLNGLRTGRLDAAQLLARRPSPPSWARRQGPRVETVITVDNAASGRFTVIDVVTADQPALLHRIAEVLRVEGVSIALAKVNTEGSRAVDVFYVVDRGGEKLHEASRLLHLRRAIEEGVFQPERASRPPEPR